MEGIKLTNFTKSRKIYEYLNKQFNTRFEEVCNSKDYVLSVTEFVLSTFKDYPSFRNLFDGYTNDEKDAIAFLLGTIVISDENQVKTKILNSITTVSFGEFVDEHFDDFEIKFMDDEIDTRKSLSKAKYPQKVSIPSNILSWIKENGMLNETKQVARWLNKLTGRNFSGGTSIGKSPQTLILDITTHSSDVYISGNTYEIKVCGIPVTDYKSFKAALETKYKIE